LNGPVRAGFVGPNSATSGRLNAALTSMPSVVAVDDETTLAIESSLVASEFDKLFRVGRGQLLTVNGSPSAQPQPSLPTSIRAEPARNTISCSMRDAPNVRTTRTEAISGPRSTTSVASTSVPKPITKVAPPAPSKAEIALIEKWILAGATNDTPADAGSFKLASAPIYAAPPVISALAFNGLPVQSSAFVRGTVACTGSEFCKLALTETKGFARWLSTELDDRFPGFAEQIKLHITGCPNSCGQHWIADIGIEGKKIKVDGKLVDAYYFCVGGSVGHIASIARPVGFRCRADEVPDAISRLLDAFQSDRRHGESLQHFLARHSNDVLRSILAGGPTLVAVRDLSESQVPHSVEDR
jgi:hypothetical protein